MPAPKRVREISKVDPHIHRKLSISQVESVKARGKSVNNKSLNFAVRKMENDRIERENHRFAKKLFENDGNISKKKLDDHFINQESYRTRITKIKPQPNRLMFLDPSLSTKSGKLPPLFAVASDSRTKFAIQASSQRSKTSLKMEEGPAETKHQVDFGERPLAASEAPHKNPTRAKLH